jgi:myo-inositol 2-dehydrogenase/D-chiro-inositol 1-dehydrogenase
MYISEKYPTGIKFLGDSGWLWVTRGKVLEASDPRILTVGIKDNELRLHASPKNDHHLDWLTSVRTRQAPVAPAEDGHRSCTACLVAHAAMRLGRELQWDPAAERFVNDEAANALLARPQRAPYGTDLVVAKTKA